MTTLAFDGVLLAADSGASQGLVRLPWMTRKLWVYAEPRNGYRAFCGCGEYQDVLLANRFFLEGRSGKEPQISNDFAGFVVREGLVYTMESQLVEEAVVSLYARGSGREFAIGAMEMGADAVEAVRVAIKWMTSHALPIQWFNVRTGEFGDLAA